MGEWIFSLTFMVITHLCVDGSVLVRLAHEKISALIKLIFDQIGKSSAIFAVTLFNAPIPQES
jgi:hypothetical protein